MDEFEARNQQNIARMGQDPEFNRMTRAWFDRASRYEYSYHFTWLGRPVIQFPQDIIALQEIIWRVKPDVIIETGIARGGSLVFYASMLELLGGDGRVIGIDVDIREPNRVELEQHPLRRRMQMIQGSSIDPAVVRQVHELARGARCPMVVLDSNHTHAHALAEMRAYSDLVHPPSYMVVCDTVIEDMAGELCAQRPWSKGNNPRTAVAEFMLVNDRFAVDEEIESKLAITVCPGGYLLCVKER